MIKKTNLHYGPIMLDLEGTELSQEEHELLQHPLVGGLILFSRNYSEPKQLRALLQDIRQARKDILIAVDQEGGRVQRLQEGFTRLPPLAEFGNYFQRDGKQALQLAEQSAYTMASELIAMDIDFSFTPVLDVNYGISRVIGDRSFADDPQTVVTLARAYIKGMHNAGMAAIGKHFPGHGAVIADSHHELPIDERDIATITQFDLVPYAQLGTELGGIMTAHIVYKEIDKQPATFSKYWLQTILREKLNYRGVIFSDDLSMGGADMGMSYVERARAALTAGCDMVLVCNNRAGAISTLNELGNYNNESAQTRLQALRAKKHLVFE